LLAITIPQLKHLTGIIISYTKLLYYSYIFLFLIQFYFFMFNYIIIIMAGFRADMNKYEKLIKNDLLNLRGQSNRVATEIARGNGQYKADVMLWIACARPDIPDEYCAMLIDRFGADPDYVAPFGSYSSCLMVASGLPNPKKVELLLKNDADPNYQSPITGYTALLIAVMARPALNCRMLIFAGANPDVVYRQAVPDEDNPVEELRLLDYANTLDDPIGIKIYEALTTLPAEVSTITATFIDESMQEGFLNHDFGNIEDLYNFLNVPQEDPNVGDEVGGSSRKRKRTNKKRKTNKKRRTNRRK
jgi:hypothetical protein